VGARFQCPPLRHARYAPLPPPFLSPLTRTSEAARDGGQGGGQDKAVRGECAYAAWADAAAATCLEPDAAAPEARAARARSAQATDRLERAGMGVEGGRTGAGRG